MIWFQCHLKVAPPTRDLTSAAVEEDFKVTLSEDRAHFAKVS